MSVAKDEIKGLKPGVQSDGKEMNIMKTAKETRLAEIARLEKVPYNQPPKKGIDSGAWGKALELSLTPSRSKKTTVAGHGVEDNYFHLDGKRVPVEIKSNGGRIGALLKMEKPQNAYVVYRLHLCNSTTSGKMVDIPAKIMTVSRFLEILQKTGAVRENSRDKEPCIQPSKRGLWKELEGEMSYDPDRHYIKEEIR